MRKFTLSLTLLFALAASVTAGEVPITGFAGCAPGLWYPESHVCVYEVAAETKPVKEQSTNMDAALIEAILFFRPMF
jgi:hypothetical protein